jgi:5'-phosphate synthase pdxT subunit
MIGVLALQGGFARHRAMLENLGADCLEVRTRADLARCRAIVLPGGESTTIGKLLVSTGLLEPLRERILEGLPTLATCAGLILLCREIAGSDQIRLGVLDATVSRNAYGRQVESFETLLDIHCLGETPFPAVFIRAPILTRLAADIEILAEFEDRPVLIRFARQIVAASFHPELTGDDRLHERFLAIC